MDRFVVKTSRKDTDIGKLTSPFLINKTRSTIDRFLVKTPRPKDQSESQNEDCVLLNSAHVSRSYPGASSSGGISSVCKSKTKGKRKQQSTIPSLPSVVVIEDIYAIKTKLKHPNQSPEVLLGCLKELVKKVPPRHVLLSSKIGQTVKKLRTHQNEEVSQAAKRVYIKWKKYFEEKLEKPQIEVKCDLKTEDMRLKGKTYLSQVLELETEHHLVEGVERETFCTHKRMISPAYRRTMRNFVFKLKCSEELRSDLKSGALSIEEFVKQYKKS